MQYIPKILIKPIEKYFIDQYDLATFLSIVALTTNNLQNIVKLSTTSIPLKKNKNIEDESIPTKNVITYMGQGIFGNIFNNIELLRDYGKIIGKDLINNQEILQDHAISTQIAAFYWRKQQLFKFKGHLQSLQNILKFDTIDTSDYTKISNLYQNYLEKA